MIHEDHVRLIAPGIVAGSDGIWADMGSGTGAFTLALRDAAGPAVEICSVDINARALRVQRESMDRLFPGTALHMLVEDFTRPLPLPPLDGIVAANAIHFVRDRVALLRLWRGSLKPGGRLILVEYDTDEGDPWVPFPVSWNRLPELAHGSGYEKPRLLGDHPSRYRGRIYSALLLPAA